MSTIVTGLYDSFEAARGAARDLEAAGIALADIGLVSSSPDLDADADIPSGTEAGAAAGAVLGGGAGLLAGLGMMTIPGLGPIVAAGWLASAAVGAVAGGAAGGLVGSLADLGMSENHANIYAEALKRGGTLLSARVSDDQVAIARSIIARNNPIDPGASTIDAEDGRRSLDPAASSDDGAELRRERERLSDTIDEGA